MANKNMLMIINPVSGRGILRQRIWKILETFSKADITVNVAFTKCQGDATELAKNCPDDIQTVICAGGDGTLNEVIRGLMENPTPHKLGYIPVGTTNDLATSLGIPKNPIKAAKTIIENRTALIDIGLFSNRYFNYVASFGAFTEASYNTPQEAKNILGHFAYVLEGVMSLGNIRPQHVKFTFNGTTIEDDYIFAAISNTTSMGGVLKLNEALVALNDGEFEFLVIKNPENIIQLQKIITDIMTQNFSGELVNLYHTSHLIVESETEFDWTLDGECHHGGKREEIKNIHKAINLIVPSAKSDKTE